MLELAGEEGPAVLVLDDLHWADAPTLALLRHVRHARRRPRGCCCWAPTATRTSPATTR